MTRTGRALAALVAAVAASFVLVGTVAPGPTPASAATFGAEEISSFDSDITIEPSGTLLVHETIVYDFGTVPHHGIYRDLIAREDYVAKPGYDRVYPLTVVSVHGSEGTPDQYSVEDVDSGDTTYARIKIGDPDRTITGVHTYDITYRMRGVPNAFADHDELVWNVNGVNWPVFTLVDHGDRARARAHRPRRVRDRSLRRDAPVRVGRVERRHCDLHRQAARAVLEHDRSRSRSRRARSRRRSRSSRSASTSRRRSGSRPTRAASRSACSCCWSARRSR